MTILDSFLDQLHHFETTASEPLELLPSRLASCCFEVLPIAAAAISVFTSDGFRFPIGASSPRAAYAERLQFTTGEGPCLDAMSDGSPVLASGDQIFRCWPRFNARLVGETSYRAVATFPLIDAGRVWASVDLFFCSQAELEELPVADATAVVDLLHPILLNAVGKRDPRVDNPVSAARLVTLSAMDMVMAVHRTTAKSALDALRRWAAASGMTVDAYSDGLVAGRVSLDEHVASHAVVAESVPSEVQDASWNSNPCGAPQGFEPLVRQT